MLNWQNKKSYKAMAQSLGFSMDWNLVFLFFHMLQMAAFLAQLGLSVLSTTGTKQSNQTGRVTSRLPQRETGWTEQHVVSFFMRSVITKHICLTLFSLCLHPSPSLSCQLSPLCLSLRPLLEASLGRLSNGYNFANRWWNKHVKKNVYNLKARMMTFKTNEAE